MSSKLISELTAAMVAEVPEADLAMPSGAGTDTPGVPNRVVAVAPPGSGEALVRRMTSAVETAWRRHDPDGDVVGFPRVQWVVVPEGTGGYTEQWERAQAWLARRKRIRDFEFTPVVADRVCTLTGRWPAAKDAAGRDKSEYLSKLARIKREHSAAEYFPSTVSIATAPYRAAIIRRPALRAQVDGLRTAVDWLREVEPRIGWRGGDIPGLCGSTDDRMDWLRQVEGAWCLEETWQPASLRLDHQLKSKPDPEVCDLGRASAAELAEAAGTKPATYLAILAQDVDHLGLALSRPGHDEPLRSWQRQVSAALSAAGERQQAAVEGPDCLGRIVYAGGDDVLALVPTAFATLAARRSAEAFRTVLESTSLTATVSTALVFFHVSAPLQSAVATAQQLLKRAKEQGRPGLGVTVLRRAGERATWLSHWSYGDDTALTSLDSLVAALQSEGVEGSLSARLAMGLERDATELAALDSTWRQRELIRRAVRHGLGIEAAESFAELDGDIAQALLVAQFLAAEGR